MQHVAPIENFPVEKWDTMLAVNLTAAFHTIRLAVVGMKEKGQSVTILCNKPVYCWYTGKPGKSCYNYNYVLGL